MFAVRDRDNVWHAVKSAGDENFVPIVCGEGINAPGPWWLHHEVTCPDCLAAPDKPSLIIDGTGHVVDVSGEYEIVVEAGSLLPES